MLPIVIIIFSKILGMKQAIALKRVCISGLALLALACDWLNAGFHWPGGESDGGKFDLNLHVVDVGWPGSSPMTWARKLRWWRFRLRFWLTWRCYYPYDAGGKC